MLCVILQWSTLKLVSVVAEKHLHERAFVYCYIRKFSFPQINAAWRTSSDFDDEFQEH